MKFKEIGTYVRPSTSVPWATEIIDRTARSADYQEKYVLTGKVISDDSELSADELTIAHTRVWLTEEDYRDFLANPLTIQLFDQYNQYNNSVGIVHTKTESVVENV